MPHLLRTFVHEEIHLQGFDEDARSELVLGDAWIHLGRTTDCQMRVSSERGGIGLIGGRRSFTFRHDGGGWCLDHGSHGTAVLINGERFAYGSHRLVEGDELSFLTTTEAVAFTLRFVEGPSPGRS